MIFAIVYITPGAITIQAINTVRAMQDLLGIGSTNGALIVFLYFPSIFSLFVFSWRFSLLLFVLIFTLLNRLFSIYTFTFNFYMLVLQNIRQI